MRTLIVSDLHLGIPSKRDSLRSPRARDALLERARGADRVVLLGDTIELTETTLERALAVARPFFERLGSALGEPGEVILTAGNHDRDLVLPWVRAHLERLTPFELEEAIPLRTSAALAAVADALRPARIRVAYPGVWLRDDVYATHGHYLDAHLTPPMPLPLLWRDWHRRISPPGDPATPADYERALAAPYDTIASRAVTRHERSRGLPKRVAGTLLFAASALAPGFGDGSAELSVGLMASKIGKRPLGAIAAVVHQLGIRTGHVVFGHVHRAGPLPGDDPAQWRTADGVELHNPGSWLDTGVVRDPDSGYWHGRCIELVDDAPPAIVSVLAG